MLGGDRFYALARWLVLLLLFAIAGLLTKEPIWPPTIARNPIHIIIWCYAAFNILATLALLIPPLRAVRVYAFVADIATITLLVLFSKEHAELFYPLYLLPLIAVAMQLSSRTSLWTGVVATVCFIVAFLVGHMQQNHGIIPQDVLGIVALALQAITLIFVPWLAGGLAERSGIINRHSVALAEQETQRAWQEAYAYRDQMRALYEVAYTLSTTMNYQSVLDATLVESRKLVPYVSALVLLSTGEPDELYIAASYGLSQSDQRARIQVEPGSISKALRSGDSCSIDDVSQELSLRSINGLRTKCAGCVVPLRAALQTYGVMVIVGDGPTPFSDEQIGMVTALAHYAIIALHNAQLIHDLREERSKLISKEEEVRHQLARDLHDGPAQALAAITMNVEFIKRLMDRDPQRVPTELDKLGAMAKRTTQEVRIMLFELRPLVLETQGIDTTLRQYFDRIENKGVEIILDSEPINADLDTKTEGTLFNIIQESVNNALKHAQAQHIWVRLKQKPTAIEATVEDDGRGFDLKKVRSTYEQRGSFGLLNIEERAKLIGGIAELQSTPGQGTTVRVIVPLHG